MGNEWRCHILDNDIRHESCFMQDVFHTEVTDIISVRCYVKPEHVVANKTQFGLKLHPNI